jgi:hypothetical protein
MPATRKGTLILGPSQINVAAQVGVQAADLTDKQLQHFCAHHSSHDEVRTVDLHNCDQIVSAECLRVLSELRQLGIKGCDRISIASFVVLQTACANLELDVSEFLGGHGSFEEALAYHQEKLTTALAQAGDCESERARERTTKRERKRGGGVWGVGSDIVQQHWWVLANQRAEP